MNKQLAVIKVSRATPARRDNCSFITNVEPQNDSFARDNLLYRDAWVPVEQAMVFPLDVAELVAARFRANPGRATPTFFVEVLA